MITETKSAHFRPLRIAVIGGRGVPSSYSGVERVWEDMFAWFANRGHKITIYCRPQVMTEKTATHKGMRLVRQPAPGGKNGETLSHSFFSLLHTVLRGDVHDGGKPFDLVSLHTIAPCLFAPIATLAGIPVAAHVHGLDHQREKWKGIGSRIIHLGEKVMVRTADHIAVVNPQMIDYYRDVYKKPADLAPNGIYPVDDSYEPDASVLAKYGLERGKYIVSVGRIVPEKRTQDIVEAFARVDTDYKLVIVGKGVDGMYYHEQVRAIADRDPKRRVVFTGQQSGDALETLFRSAALYTSASELEGMPASVLECMERRVTPILSDIPEHATLYAPITGYDLSFKTGDTSALATKIQYALAHPEHCRTLGERARAHVRKEYSWPALAARMEQIYLQIADQEEHPDVVPQAT